MRRGHDEQHSETVASADQDPGESDGECTRGLGPAGDTVDPEWGRIDPAAGDWFPEMALQLASNADPVLRP